MARDTTDSTFVSSINDLTDYIAAGEKPESKFRIGTEHEKFVFFTKDNSPVPYHGEASIKTLLDTMQTVSAGNPIIDAGNIIGLAEPDMAWARSRWSPAASSNCPARRC
jgi:glutamate--cysteine ligase